MTFSLETKSQVLSLIDVLDQTMQIDPRAHAVDHQQAWWSWGDLHRLQQSICDHLDTAGAGRGARIGILFRSRPAHVAALLACVLNGRCAVSFNVLLPADVLAADLLEQNVSVLVGETADLGGGGVQTSVRAVALPLLALDHDERGLAHWITEMHSSSDRALRRRSPGVLIEMLTSGTTGPPKRIPLELTNFEESFHSAHSYERSRRRDDRPALRSGVRIITAPLTHVSGVSAVLMSLAGGRKICLLEKFAVEPWVAAVQRHKAKVGNAPPAALRMVLDANVPPAALKSLVALRSGTAPLDPAMVDAFLAKYNLPILGQYGATEFAGSVAGWTLDEFRTNYAAKRGSVGRLQPNIEGRIVDPELSTPMLPGEAGILELRGRQINSTGEWVRTTDRASIDADGYLYILGRADSAINRGGFKIQPDDVARALQQHPVINEAVVVGIKHRRLGEVPGAMATVRPGEQYPDVQEVIQFLKSKLLAYQIPTHIEFVRDFPRTAMLKPNLPEIRRLLEMESSVENKLT
jgi:long-chain acyl-CoA synthetase